MIIGSAGAGLMRATAWDISGSYYDNKVGNVSAETTSVTGVWFKSDGLAMYVSGGTTRKAWQYTLSTAWDVSTAVYANKQIDFSVEIAVKVDGIFLRSDGANIYALDSVASSGSRIYQYALSTPYDLSTGSFVALHTLTVGGQESDPSAIFFSPDGSKCYVAGQGVRTVFQYTLGTPWDLTTGSYASLSKDVSAQVLAPYGLYFKDDGTRMFVLDYGDKIYQYTLGTPWDVSTATYAGISFDVTAQDNEASGLAFRADGTGFYIAGDQNNRIYQYLS